ncbi:hypothetical protein ABZX51_009370 [Aspergillus tubingensis]
MAPAQPDHLNATKRSIMRVNPQRRPVPTRRHRKALSCASCRDRKVKCDRSKPCAQCVRANAQDACFYPSATSSPSQSSLVVRPRSAKRLPNVPREDARSASGVRQLSAGLSLDTPPSTVTAGSTCNVDGDAAARRSIFRSSPLNAVGSTRGITAPRCFDVEPQYDRGQASSASGDTFSQYLSPLSFRGKQQRTRFFGRSHWATTLGMFPDFNAHLHEYYRNKQTPTNPGFTDYLSLRRLKHDLRGPERRRQSDQPPSSKLIGLLPDRPLAEYLMRSYFSTFETTLRILHVPSFISEWNAFCDRSVSHADGLLNNKSDIFIAKLLMLMACASCFATENTEPLASAGFSPQSLIQTCHTWISAVTTWLAAMTSHAQLNLDVIQIKCLLLLAQQATAQDGDLASLASGSLLREALLMGLHRDPCNFPNVSPFWAELRKRLWLTIIELELQASLYSGIPLAVSWDEFDSPLPSDIDDEDITIDSLHLPPSRQSNTLTRTSFQIALAQTLETRIAISKMVNRVRLSATYNNEVTTLSERLTTGLAQAPADLRDDTSTSPSPNESSVNTEFRRSFFLFLHYRSLLALHRPFFLQFTETQLDQESFIFSRRVCVQTSLALLSQLERFPHHHHHHPNNSQPSAPLPNNDNQFSPHIHHLKGGLFRDDLFHAAATICFELRLQTRSHDRVFNIPFPGTSISKYMDQSVYYQRLALFESVENTIRYFEGKVRVEKRATKMFSILMILFMVVRSEMAAAAGGSIDGGGGEETEPLGVDDACPVASRRCRDALLEGYQCQDEGRGIGHLAEGEGGGVYQVVGVIHCLMLILLWVYQLSLSRQSLRKRRVWNRIQL